MKEEDDVFQWLLLMNVLGETFSIKLIELLMENGHNGEVWNVCGPAETTIDCTIHRVNVTTNETNIPIGCPFPNYHCLIKDDFSQDVAINEEGELYVGGVGVFAGYLGQKDLTEKVLVQIDGEMFYRTGDLVHLDDDGLLHYLGRKDHQVKLHGQRIELGEIERCLLKTSISACVVVKWGEDHLVAYVQSSTVNEEELHQHCQSHLPPHMVPSVFMIMEKLPLNANGKIDRKQLPSPIISATTLSSRDETDSPHTQLEGHVHKIWCQVLRCADEQQISTTTSFFGIGGHSLLFIELYHRYQSLLDFDTRQLSITIFLQQPTIAQHAQLLQSVTSSDIKSAQWCTLHICEGKH